MLLRSLVGPKRPAYLYQPDGENDLLALPESGPGYQLVRIAALAGPVVDGDYVVFNAELLVPIAVVWDDSWDPALVWNGRLTYDEYKQSLNATAVSGLGGPPPPTSIPGTGTPGGPRSTLIVHGTTAARQRLWRLSAYNPDRRITLRNELALGAYITSDLDKTFFNTGLGAVGRLALPTPFPATYAYAVDPAPGTPYDAGTVRPAFGQTGGGVEVTLHHQTPPASVHAPITLTDI
jgi:hypothetical protein